MIILIDIPKEQYEYIRHENKSYDTELCLMNAVCNGTVLNEIDDLISRKSVMDCQFEIDNSMYVGTAEKVVLVKDILELPSIIEELKRGSNNEKL